MSRNTTPEPDISSGVPFCTNECRHHDGKRCKLLGLRPDNICEPAVREMADSLQKYRKLRDVLRGSSINFIEIDEALAAIEDGGE